MSPTWEGDPPPEQHPPGPVGWARAFAKAVVAVALLVTGLTLLLALRFPERARYGQGRPWTPAIVRAVCRAVLAIIGLKVEPEGQAMAGPGAMVANHASWLDILVLNSLARVVFVAKAEVAGWPAIGPLARAAGTVFIRRERSDAHVQRALLAERIGSGTQILFFPEGTSTDGRRVLAFKPTLFAAFFETTLPGFAIQPVTVVYTAPPGHDARFYGWWGDMGLGGHLLAVLAAPRHGRVRVVFHAPLTVADFADRKALARAAEAAVRAPFAQD